MFCFTLYLCYSFNIVFCLWPQIHEQVNGAEVWRERYAVPEHLIVWFEAVGRVGALGREYISEVMLVAHWVVPVGCEFYVAFYFVLFQQPLYGGNSQFEQRRVLDPEQMLDFVAIILEVW